MEYKKPEIVVLAQAVSAIQGVKPSGPLDSNGSQTIHTTNAYEADE